MTLSTVVMTSNAGAAVAEPADAKADNKSASQDAQLASDQIAQLHRELSDAAVAESAEASRIVWAQVKGFPFWPVRLTILLTAYRAPFSRFCHLFGSRFKKSSRYGRNV